MMESPIAKRIPYVHVLHDDIRRDDYYWLKERNDPEVIAYLEAENRYYEEHMQPLEELTEQLYQEMFARMDEDEIDVPIQASPYYYYSRTEKGKQYSIYARKRANSRDLLDQTLEEVILDVNTLAKEDEYLSVNALRVSPDHSKLAYLDNRDGTDRYVVCVKDLLTGEQLSDRIEDVFIDGSLEWDATGHYLFYITVDDAQRPYRLWRHHVGNAGLDELLYEEVDSTFALTLQKSRSGEYLFLKSETKTTTEVRYLRADQPTSEFHVFDARQKGIEYEIEHVGDTFLILTNKEASQFKVLQCPIETMDQASRVELFPYDASRYLQAMYPFKDAVVLFGRQDGLTQIWIYRDGSLSRLNWDEPLYTVRLAYNISYDTTEVIFHYESLLTPKITYSLNLLTGERVVLKKMSVPGSDYVSDEYTSERIFATAHDGAQIPLSVVYRKGAMNKGPAPLILYGYGSYGANSDPMFDATRLPFMDRGIIFVTAQIRGGSEMGRFWYEDGKLMKKMNTFTDFFSAAQDLIQRGYTTSSQLAARGGSAGGLLMGAVINLSTDLFQVVVADVPFVDVVTTMVDDTLPLTSLEWDEWGDPREVEAYHYMKSYSPYDQVEAKDYPHLLVTTGLNDPRVAYFEPAKWVARLRVTKTDDHQLLLKTNMGAGHFGSSGRYNRLKELAGRYAFILDKIQ